MDKLIDKVKLKSTPKERKLLFAEILIIVILAISFITFFNMLF